MVDVLGNTPKKRSPDLFKVLLPTLVILSVLHVGLNYIKVNWLPSGLTYHQPRQAKHSVLETSAIRADLYGLNSTLQTANNITVKPPPILPKCVLDFKCEPNNNVTHTLRLDNTSFEVISKEQRDVQVGGAWRPLECQSEWRIAVIIPIRDREDNLKIFIRNIIPFLKNQKADFTIFAVEQVGEEIFNKAQTMDAGFVEVQKLGHYDCFIFHDVDMVPVNQCNRYKCESGAVRHLGISRNIAKPHLVYGACIGGGSAFTKTQFLKINGFTTVFFGWGGEDDDGYFRSGLNFDPRLQRLEANVLMNRALRLCMNILQYMNSEIKKFKPIIPQRTDTSELAVCSIATMHSLRIKKENMRLYRYKPIVGNYYSLPHFKFHKKHFPKVGRSHEAVTHWKYRKYDGLNTLTYKVLNVTKQSVLTRIQIVIPGPINKDQIRPFLTEKRKLFEEMYRNDTTV